MSKPIGYQGLAGSFSEQALHQYFGDDVATTSVKYFEDVFLELDANNIDYGILPIENSNTGGIFEVYDLLQQYNRCIVGETFVQVAHHLLAHADATLDTIEVVYSHPQGFEQSRRFLKRFNNQWELVPYYNTAISARHVQEQNCKTKAAIASLRCSQIYDLKVLQPNIQDEDHNYTRFIIIGQELEESAEADKLSIIYALPHSVGSLYQSLGIFASHGLNILNLQSRPIRGKPWEAYFYLDFAGHLGSENVQSALATLRQSSSYLQILGNYGAKPNRLPLE